MRDDTAMDLRKNFESVFVPIVQLSAAITLMTENTYIGNEVSLRTKTS